MHTFAIPAGEPTAPMDAVHIRPYASAIGMAESAKGVAKRATGEGKPATAIARETRVQNQDAIRVWVKRGQRVGRVRFP